MGGVPHAGSRHTCNAEDPSSIPGSGRSYGEGIGYSFQYSWASLVAQLVEESTCNAGDPSLIPGSGRSAGEGIGYSFQYSWASFVALKNLPTMQETWVKSLRWEDSLEEGMATHSSILAWRILMDRGAWWATVHGSQRTMCIWKDKNVHLPLFGIKYQWDTLGW